MAKPVLVAVADEDISLHELTRELGLQAFVLLILLTGLLYFTKKKVWANAH